MSRTNRHNHDEDFAGIPKQQPTRRSRRIVAAVPTNLRELTAQAAARVQANFEEEEPMRFSDDPDTDDPPTEMLSVTETVTETRVLRRRKPMTKAKCVKGWRNRISEVVGLFCDGVAKGSQWSVDGVNGSMETVDNFFKRLHRRLCLRARYGVMLLKKAKPPKAIETVMRVGKATVTVVGDTCIRVAGLGKTLVISVTETLILAVLYIVVAVLEVAESFKSLIKEIAARLRSRGWLRESHQSKDVAELSVSA